MPYLLPPLSLLQGAIRSARDHGGQYSKELREEAAHAVSACVANAQLLYPRNVAAEVQCRVVAAEVYGSLEQWPDVLRHATVALQDIEACETTPEMVHPPTRDGSPVERPDPLKSTYKRSTMRRTTRQGKSLDDSLVAPDVLGVTMESVLKMRDSGKWAAPQDTLTVPRELAGLREHTGDLGDRNIKFSLASPEPMLPGNQHAAVPPDASQMVAPPRLAVSCCCAVRVTGVCVCLPCQGAGGRAAMLETYEGFGSFFRSYCSALRRQNGVLGAAEDNGDAMDSFSTHTSIDGSPLPLLPLPAHTVQLHFWIRRLFSESYASSSPWTWLTAVCAKFCTSLGALCEYPPTKTPRPKFPQKPLSWRDIVRCLRHFRPVAKGVPAFTKPSRSKMAYSEEVGEGGGRAGGVWSFSNACAATWRHGGIFADVVEEFVAGTDGEVAAAVAILLEELCR